MISFFLKSPQHKRKFFSIIDKDERGGGVIRNIAAALVSPEQKEHDEQLIKWTMNLAVEFFILYKCSLHTMETFVGYEHDPCQMLPMVAVLETLLSPIGKIMRKQAQLNAHYQVTLKSLEFHQEKIKSQELRDAIVLNDSLKERLKSLRSEIRSRSKRPREDDDQVAETMVTIYPLDDIPNSTPLDHESDQKVMDSLKKSQLEKLQTEQKQAKRNLDRHMRMHAILSKQTVEIVALQEEIDTLKVELSLCEEMRAAEIKRLQSIKPPLNSGYLHTAEWPKNFKTPMGHELWPLINGLPYFLSRVYDNLQHCIYNIQHEADERGHRNLGYNFQPWRQTWYDFMRHPLEFVKRLVSIEALGTITPFQASRQTDHDAVCDTSIFCWKTLLLYNITRVKYLLRHDYDIRWRCYISKFRYPHQLVSANRVFNEIVYNGNKIERDGYNKFSDSVTFSVPTDRAITSAQKAWAPLDTFYDNMGQLVKSVRLIGSSTPCLQNPNTQKPIFIVKLFRIFSQCDTPWSTIYVVPNNLMYPTRVRIEMSCQKWQDLDSIRNGQEGNEQGAKDQKGNERGVKDQKGNEQCVKDQKGVNGQEGNERDVILPSFSISCNQHPYAILVTHLQWNGKKFDEELALVIDSGGRCWPTRRFYDCDYTPGNPGWVCGKGPLLPWLQCIEAAPLETLSFIGKTTRRCPCCNKKINKKDVGLGIGSTCLANFHLEPSETKINLTLL